MVNSCGEDGSGEQRFPASMTSDSGCNPVPHKEEEMVVLRVNSDGGGGGWGCTRRCTEMAATMVRSKERGQSEEEAKCGKSSPLGHVLPL
jgi:hypothetical protein